MAAYTYPTLSLVVVIAVLHQFFERQRNKSKRLPPGPKPLPLIGNVLDLPSERAWLKYTKWKQQYGDMVYLNVFGRPMLILNSLKACTDLLEKRSAIYSDRPRMIMATELIKYDFNLVLMRNTSRWRNSRKIFHQYFNESATMDLRPVQEQQTHSLLLRLLQTPDEFLEHVRLHFAEMIMKVAYDIKVKDHNDPYFTRAEIVNGEILTSSLPGKYLVDVFPFLKHVPSWMPGAKFQRQAKEWGQIVSDMRDLPVNQVKENMAQGTAGPSVLASILSTYGLDDDPASSSGADSIESIARGTVATAYAGGSDTTVSSIQGFFLAMANYPEVQKMAQEELDAVVGNRLPTFEDAPNLPYLRALIKELLRWHNIGPLAAPHASTEDDVYEGYFIPKGTVVCPNVWLILHDPEIYPDPFTFNPSRWLIKTEKGLELNPNAPEPTAAFGFGRRSCPGRHFADNALFINISSILTCFSISALDASGRPTDHIEEKFTDGIIIYPEPFKVSITPRSQKVALMINEAVAQSD